MDDLQPYHKQILELARQYGASDVRVSGSVARGEATSDSDLDLLVTFGEHSLVDRIELMQSLSDLLGCRVDR